MRGTLTDITSKSANKANRNAASPFQKTPTVAPSEKGGTSKANFMTPTMASVKRNTTPSASNADIRSSTPSSAKADKGGKGTSGRWMTSAARRVGLRRNVGDGTPRSKKEASKMIQTTVTFPDKVRTFILQSSMTLLFAPVHLIPIPPSDSFYSCPEEKTSKSSGLTTL
ncbi:MAG: hypothetical protein Q9183_003701 [Haloplaca sp. 2 TL-2023]